MERDRTYTFISCWQKIMFVTSFEHYDFWSCFWFEWCTDNVYNNDKFNVKTLPIALMIIPFGNENVFSMNFVIALLMIWKRYDFVWAIIHFILSHSKMIHFILSHANVDASLWARFYASTTLKIVCTFFSIIYHMFHSNFLEF